MEVISMKIKKYAILLTAAVMLCGCAGNDSNISDVSNLQTTLNGKANTTHNHDDKYIIKNSIVNRIFFSLWTIYN